MTATFRNSARYRITAPNRYPGPVHEVAAEYFRWASHDKIELTYGKATWPVSGVSKVEMWYDGAWVDQSPSRPMPPAPDPLKVAKQRIRELERKLVEADKIISSVRGTVANW